MLLWTIQYHQWDFLKHRHLCLGLGLLEPGMPSPRPQAPARSPLPSMASTYQDPTCCHRVSTNTLQQQISLFSARSSCTICNLILRLVDILFWISHSVMVYEYLFVYVCPNIDNTSTLNIYHSLVKRMCVMPFSLTHWSDPQHVYKAWVQMSTK